MSKSRFLVILGLICALCVVSFGVASADVRSKESGATRDIVLVEEDSEEGEDAEAKLQMEEMASEGDPLGLKLWSDRSEKGDVYDIGDKMTVFFKAEKDCYLTVLDFTPSGSIYKLFPNKWMTDGFVKAGQEIAIPAKGQKFSLKVGGPAGTDVIKAIATNQETKVIDEENEEIMGPFSSIKDAKAATRDILLVEEEEEVNSDKPLEWDAVALSIHTRGESDEKGGFGVAEKDGWVAKMWLDRDNFLTGEPMFLKFSSNMPCTVVKVVNDGVSGKHNDLLPEGTTLNVNPGSIVILPGKEHKFKLVPSTPVGLDTITAYLAGEDGTEMDLSLKVLIEE
ncbi:DUF4384 domain-containing protein [Dethiosulfovibrio sp. F2B]|uniref:DUF4384 domain-containing protein n=1 Tax=Dethiosulfovibrio faecalis TaxID=2720018 RepID=UPI001F47EB2C|nr:DUF4384 domain-containing protein [Dethiosulfovibrio faecalis]MCF4152407.1 DUF4384 domain-containing protein [Dethiosulfovibrio faecalis]